MKSGEQFSLEFNDIIYKVVNNSKNTTDKYVMLLKGVSGKFLSGRLTGLLGSSGSAKTSFFDILSGCVQKNAVIEGEILLRGAVREISEWGRKCGYMQQKEESLGRLTVYEFVSFYGYCFYNKMESVEIENIINDRLSELGLKSIQNIQMNMISSGQLKRVMVAVELLAERDVIFLDEPTSGLDAQTAMHVTEVLKKHARMRNIVIVMTIHQPGCGVFGMIDDLFFLDRGRILYNGPAENLEKWLYTLGLLDFTVEDGDKNMTVNSYANSNSEFGSDANLIKGDANNESIISENIDKSIISKEEGIKSRANNESIISENIDKSIISKEEGIKSRISSNKCLKSDSSPVSKDIAINTAGVEKYKTVYPDNLSMCEFLFELFNSATIFKSVAKLQRKNIFLLNHLFDGKSDSNVYNENVSYTGNNSILNSNYNNIDNSLSKSKSDSNVYNENVSYTGNNSILNSNYNNIDNSLSKSKCFNPLFNQYVRNCISESNRHYLKQYNNCKECNNYETCKQCSDPNKYGPRKEGWVKYVRNYEYLINFEHVLAIMKRGLILTFRGKIAKLIILLSIIFGFIFTVGMIYCRCCSINNFNLIMHIDPDFSKEIPVQLVNPLTFLANIRARFKAIHPELSDKLIGKLFENDMKFFFVTAIAILIKDSIPGFIEEGIVYRDVAKHVYSVPSYVIGKIIVEFLFIIPKTCTFIIIFYIFDMGRFSTHSEVFIFFIYIVLLQMITIILWNFITSISKNIVFLIFCSIIINITHIFVQPVAKFDGVSFELDKVPELTTMIFKAIAFLNPNTHLMIAYNTYLFINIFNHLFLDIYQNIITIAANDTPKIVAAIERIATSYHVNKFSISGIKHKKLTDQIVTVRRLFKKGLVNSAIFSINLSCYLNYFCILSFSVLFFVLICFKEISRFNRLVCIL